jgi:transcriptional regulator
MYLPAQTEERDVSVLHALIRNHPLGAWVTNGPDGLIANHIPFLLRVEGDTATLVGHVARANPVWQSFSTSQSSLVMFQGPESYVSPSWYPAKHAHGKVVPTWNYVVVHAHGVPRAIEDLDWLLQHVTQLSNTHEATQSVPWKVTDAPSGYIDKLRRAIVGIEIPIATLTGKWKISRNRPTADQHGVVAGLQSRGTDSAAAMAALMAHGLSTTKPPSS